MIHSASFRATGSDIAASAWVASAGLCLRTSSITFSSASVSVREVDAVAATAAGAGGGLRGVGSAACWRVAGARLAGAVVMEGTGILRGGGGGGGGGLGRGRGGGCP